MDSREPRLLPVTESLRPVSMRFCISRTLPAPTNAAPARTHSGEVRHLRRHARMYRGRVARVIDHMVDRAVIAERYGDHVVEPYLRALWRLDCPGQPDIRIDEDAVHAQPPRLMRRHSIRHFVGGPAVHPRRTRIARLVRRIVRNLGLIKIRSPAIALPQNLELLVMLHKQAIDRDLVSIHH